MSLKPLSMLPANLHPVAPTGTGPGQGGQGKRNTSTTSLNHLLNFSLPPREPIVQHRPRRARRQDQSTAVWNKERFVNAQHRFVLRPSGDYAVHFADPDIFFQWPDILEVIIPPPSTVQQSSSTLQCPICLSPPVAPRMTKCGHVYCYPCILHYLETADARKWARCPICFDSIYEKALKPVMFLPEDAGDGALGAGSIRMRLMIKPPNTTLVLPRSSSWPSALIPTLNTPFLFLPDVLTFSRFMFSTPQHLHSSAKRDIAALEAELASLEALHDELGASFVRRAMERVREWEEQVDEMDLEDSGAKERDKAERELEAFRARERRRERDRQREKDKSEKDGAPLPEAPIDYLNVVSASPIPGTPVQPAGFTGRRPYLPPPPPPTYFFYQAANGAAVFLHPLDIRIIRSTYGGYEKFPDAVVLGVEASEEGRVTPALRKTHKYLSHLPEGQDITFIEADLSTLCTAEQLAPFADLLHKRRERRREREEKEERARRKAERDAEAEIAATAWGQSAGRGARAAERDWQSWEGGDVDDEAEHGGDTAASSPRSSGDHAPAPAPSTSAPSTSPSGAWGTRTFASAALSNAAGAARPRPTSHGSAVGLGGRTSGEEVEWEREVDIAWHELESRALQERGGGGGGGRRKKKAGTKLVLLGGSGRGRA